mmetsp:Transcript_26713/g.36887  ORF Transcript_26713/g.36887 Transcript_26713/m.36887 type:complete len:262 (-) Transcript_26713:104-889(-)
MEVHAGFEELKKLWHTTQEAAQKPRWTFASVIPSKSALDPKHDKRPPRAGGHSHIHSSFLPKSLPSGFSFKKKMCSSAGGFQVVLNLEDLDYVASKASSQASANSLSFLQETNEPTAVSHFHRVIDHGDQTNQSLEEDCQNRQLVREDSRDFSKASIDNYVFELNPMCRSSVEVSEQIFDYRPQDVFPGDFETQAFTFSEFENVSETSKVCDHERIRIDINQGEEHVSDSSNAVGCASKNDMEVWISDDILESTRQMVVKI